MWGWIARVTVFVCVAAASTETPAHATLPGDVGRIAFVAPPDSCPNASVANVFSVLPDGRRRRRLTSHSCSSTFNTGGARWSPDGRRLLYLNRDLGDLPRSPTKFVVMRADGSRKRVAARADAADAVWAPDGKELAWVHYGEKRGVYVGPFRNPSERFIAYGTNPAWSPDGQSLALVEPAGFHESCYQLSIYDARSGARRRVLVAPSEQADFTCVNAAVTPDWSPDGRRLAYAGTGARSGASSRNYEIYVIGRDGGKARRLTHNDSEDTQPVWSPDGRRIAFSRSFARRNGLYLMRRDGTGERRLVADARGVGGWQPLPRR